MIAVDTNVLVYAHRDEYEFHERARAVITDLATGRHEWAIPWPCVHEFLAVVTNLRIHHPPTPIAAAWDQVEAWLECPTLRLIGESRQHSQTLCELVTDGDVTGARVHDARIAAICLDHGVHELLTMDRDFSRLPRLRTRSLLA